ncbi:Uma2 family endonuclease [Streptomyces sp. R21]|uniref:Uma2 family endonuclease n=1 Tax=Streptomyces sp. R21 TaxID=3238627 RepID=A0AB39P7X9_9ACTN
MDYAKMRAIAEELTEYAERLEGSWNVEIGPSGPFLAMTSPSKRHKGTVRRIRNQLNAQLPATHPGYVCENGPEIVSPSNPDNDYGEKLAEYPAMGIAHYMIVDPRTGTIEVHSAPCSDRYQEKDPYIFGDTVPFGSWTVETGAFRRYGKAGNARP